MSYGQSVPVDLVYSQSSGCLYLADSEDVRALIAFGYSGKGAARDNPACQGLRSEGPIPRGMWKLHPAVDHIRLGPCAIPLTPVGHDALGRSGFFIHGDNPRGDRSASSGCIVLPKEIRLAIGLLRCKSLLVE